MSAVLLSEQNCVTSGKFCVALVTFFKGLDAEKGSSIKLREGSSPSISESRRRKNANEAHLLFPPNLFNEFLGSLCEREGLNLYRFSQKHRL